MVEEGGEGGTQPWRVRGRATRIPKRGAALIYTSWAGSTTGRAVQPVRLIFIYRWLGIESHDSSACTTRKLGGDSLYSPPSSFFLSTRCPHGKAARREEVGTERAEVTPAPRRSRGRAPPVRFDAFLSPPPPPSSSSASRSAVRLRYVIFLSRLMRY